jgi:hypothetical protein
VLEEWNIAIVIPRFKKGDRAICDNYRGISLLCTVYKIYAKIIARIIGRIIEPLISEEQNGFRKGCSCTDSIFVIQQLVEKNREYNLETHLLFVYFKKAFYSVIRNKLWEIMINRGFQSHLIRVVQSLYHDTRICIKKENRQSKILEGIITGVRQGCPLSSILFNIYIDDVIPEMVEGFST